jgi:hypothetical protein
VGLARFERTRNRVEQNVRVNVQHANRARWRGSRL